MNDFSLALGQALALVVAGDVEFRDIVALSLQVSATSTLLACLVGMPVGAWLAVSRFPGRDLLVAIVNAALGVPSVVIGLVVYLLLSRSGPFGFLGWLFSPTAMVVAQTVLIAPMVAALSRQLLQGTWAEYRDQFASWRIPRRVAIGTLIWDCRVGLVTTALAAFGRAISEVGAVMTVGGNIAGATRVMTTGIALETSKGDLPLALGLGIVLIVIVFAVMLAAQLLQWRIAQREGASRVGD